MARVLAEKVGGDAVAVTAGDLTTSRAPGAFGLVHLVYNAITCLLSPERQAACFRNACGFRHLRPGEPSVGSHHCTIVEGRVSTFLSPRRHVRPSELGTLSTADP